MNAAPICIKEYFVENSYVLRIEKSEDHSESKLLFTSNKKDLFFFTKYDQSMLGKKLYLNIVDLDGEIDKFTSLPCKNKFEIK